MPKIGLTVIMPNGEVKDISELTKWELDKYLKNIAELDGPDMLVHHVYPILEAFQKATSEE